MGQKEKGRHAVYNLTGKEKDVDLFHKAGWSIREIGKHFGVSRQTVKRDLIRRDKYEPEDPSKKGTE